MTDALKSNEHLPEPLRQALAATPARIFTGRSGTGYPTSTLLKLRTDHAAARDAVFDEVRIDRDFEPSWVKQHQILELHTQAHSRAEYLQYPHRGRVLDANSEQLVQLHSQRQPQLQLILADGLSAKSMIQQGPPLHDLVQAKAKVAGLQSARAVLIHQCRVGILNDIGRLIQPEVAILLIGERPGLAHASSLSAYLAYRPQPGHTDALRSLISNIHPQGISITEAADRIMKMVDQMRQSQTSGVMRKLPE